VIWKAEENPRGKEAKRKMRRGTVLMLTIMAATVVLSSGIALAVTKQCPSGTTEQNPCLGTNKTKKTTDNDILMGTGGPDYMMAMSGNDLLIGGSDADTTDGGSGNDTYSFRDGFAKNASGAVGTETLKDSSGIDTLNFSGVTQGLYIRAIPDWIAFRADANMATNTSTSERVDLGSSAVERIVGSSGSDNIRGGKESNTLMPGPGGDDSLGDYGGCAPVCAVSGASIPASDDTYKGFKSGSSSVIDFGGTKDVVDLTPLASYDAYFEVSGQSLVIYISGTDKVTISGYFTSRHRIERIVFSDTTITGVEQAQTMATSTSR
jgi:Ca2+-binding RTX toxin-like protein